MHFLGLGPEAGDILQHPGADRAVRADTSWTAVTPVRSHPLHFPMAPPRATHRPAWRSPLLYCPQVQPPPVRAETPP